MSTRRWGEGTVFELSSFVRYCREHRIDVIPYAGCPRPGATLRDRGETAIFIDPTQLPTRRLLRGVCCHELGHAATGALHRVDSPYELVERSEYRARSWTARQFLTPADFRAAFRAGYREPWQLAEYFDLPEAEVTWALEYWVTRRGAEIEKECDF